MLGSYCGAFTIDYRNQLINKVWHADLVTRGVPVTNPFKLENLLTSEVEISKWNSEGLPSNDLSIQNGILTTKGSRFPLCVDPQLQVSELNQDALPDCHLFKSLTMRISPEVHEKSINEFMPSGCIIYSFAMLSIQLNFT